LEEYSFFDSAWEDLFWAEPSTLSSSISAISPGHDETVSCVPTPEKNWDYSLYSPLKYAAPEPGLDFTIDVNPVSDYELGISRHPSLSFPDGKTMATNATRSNGIDISVECNQSVTFDQFGLGLPTQSPSSEPRLAPPPHGLTASHPSPVFSSSKGQTLSVNHGLSRVPLSRLLGLKCPQCQQDFVDNLQLSRHLKKHETFPCDVEGCKAVLKTQRSLDRHKQTAAVHKDLGSGAQFACECGFETPRKDHYLRHEKTCQGARKRKR